MNLLFFFFLAAVFPFVKRKSFFGGPHPFLRRRDRLRSRLPAFCQDRLSWSEGKLQLLGVRSDRKNPQHLTLQFTVVSLTCRNVSRWCLKDGKKQGSCFLISLFLLISWRTSCWTKTATSRSPTLASAKKASLTLPPWRPSVEHQSTWLLRSEVTPDRELEQEPNHLHFRVDGTYKLLSTRKNKNQAVSRNFPLDPNLTSGAISFCPAWWKRGRTWVLDSLCLSVCHQAATTGFNVEPKWKYPKIVVPLMAAKCFLYNKCRMSLTNFTSSNVDFGGDFESYFAIKRMWKRISDMPRLIIAISERKAWPWPLKYWVSDHFFLFFLKILKRKLNGNSENIIVKY